jgi:hypothetical protein
MAPKGVDRTLVNQCGYFFRDNIPISYKLWKINKVIDNDADNIPNMEKEMLWREVCQILLTLEMPLRALLRLGGYTQRVLLEAHPVEKSRNR